MPEPTTEGRLSAPQMHPGSWLFDMARRASVENVVRFTKQLVEGFVLGGGQAERIIWDEEVRGFGVRLRASGNRTWVIRPPRSGGRSRLHTLGAVTHISLTSARRAAQEQLAKAALGGDPTRERRDARARAAITLGGLLTTYIADKQKKGRRDTTIANMRHHLNVHWKQLHETPLDALDRAEVARRHRQLAEECGPHAADRAQSILSTFFVWAMREGLVEANPVVNTNTATSPTRRERVLDDGELAALWRACREDDFGRITRLLILTGQRRNEVSGMRWDEIDLASAMWTIPSERMKNGRPHEVPLSASALKIIDALPRHYGRDLVFGDGKGAFSGFSKAKAALDRRAGVVTKPWTLHDLRRTVSTRMNSLGVLPIVVEAVLSHVSGSRSGVAGICNRSHYRAEKREALDRWAAELARLCE